MQDFTRVQRAGGQVIAVLALMAAVIFAVTLAGVSARKYKLEQMNETAALQAEQLDAYGPLTQFTVNQGLELAKSDKLQVSWQPCMVWNPWIFDMRQKPFNDLRVRQALAQAVDLVRAYL